MIRPLKRIASQRLIWFMVGSVMLLALGACNRADPQAGRPTKGPAAIRIKTCGVERISIQRQVDLAGTLISPDQARVSSEVAGIVREVLVQLGQEVQPGQVMVRLDPTELEIALQRAQSLLRQTEAQLGIDGVSIKEPLPDEQISIVRTAMANRDDARAQLARAKRLISMHLLSQADLDTAETRVKVTEAAHQSAVESVQSLKASLQERRATVVLAQKKLNDAVIKAPVAGSVSERLVGPGEFIRENIPVIGLVQMNPLKLKTAVQERYASLIQPNQSVQFRVESFPEEMFEGRISNVSPAVDQATRTFTVEVLVDNQRRKLKPGFFAKGVIFTSRDEAVLAVPDEAVSTLAGVSSVFAVEDNKVRPKQVTLGAREGKLLEVTGGLKGDELLATTNLSLLAQGVAVELETAGNTASPDSQPAQGGASGRERRKRI